MSETHFANLMHFDKIDKNEEFKSKPKEIIELLKWSMLWDKNISFLSLLETSEMNECVCCLQDALYYGKLEYAIQITKRYPGILLLRQDGLDAIQLLLSIQDKPRYTSESIVYTWGKSTDFVLGINKDKCLCTAILQGDIQCLQLSKSHAIATTSEAVYVWGSGSRLGIENVPVAFEPIKHPKIVINSTQDEIVAIALGRDHSILVRRDGQVYVFGDNSYGQCGMPLQFQFNHSPSSPQSPNIKDRCIYPTLLKTTIKKSIIIGAAASKVHSIVYSTSDVFTFGLNNGQLGFSTDTCDKQISWIPRLITITHHKHEILAVSCTDEVSFILIKTVSGSTDVFFFKGYNKYKFVNSYSNLNNQMMKHTPQLIKIKSKFLNHEKHSLFGAICNRGNLYINLLHRKSHTSLNLIKVWHAQNAFQHIIDFDFGMDGTIILCTSNGLCYSGHFRPNTLKYLQLKHLEPVKHKIYKFTRIPNAFNAKLVCASPKGAYGYQSQLISVPIKESSFPSINFNYWYANKFKKLDNTFVIQFNQHNVYFPYFLSNCFDSLFKNEINMDLLVVLAKQFDRKYSIDQCNPTVSFKGFQSNALHHLISLLYHQTPTGPITTIIHLIQLKDIHKPVKVSDYKCYFPSNNDFEIKNIVIACFEVLCLQSIFDISISDSNTTSINGSDFGYQITINNVKFYSESIPSPFFESLCHHRQLFPTSILTVENVDLFKSFILHHTLPNDLPNLIELLEMLQYFQINSEKVESILCRYVTPITIQLFFKLPYIAHTTVLKSYLVLFCKIHLSLLLHYQWDLPSYLMSELIIAYTKHVPYTLASAEDLILLQLESNLKSQLQSRQRQPSTTKSKIDSLLSTDSSPLGPLGSISPSSPLGVNINEDVFEMDLKEIKLPEPKKKYVPFNMSTLSATSTIITTPTVKKTWSIPQQDFCKINLEDSPITPSQLTPKWANTPPSPITSLNDIMKEEELQKIKNNYKKPLHIIEIEDIAEQQLLEYYYNALEYKDGTLITITRDE